MKIYRLFFTILFAAISVQNALSGDKIIVVGQNVQNFFYSLNCGRTTGNSVALSNYNTVEGRTAKLNGIINGLAPLNADIYAFNEIEIKPEGADSEALQLLADGMKNATSRNFKAVNDGLTYTDDADGLIKSGFIYDADKIELVGENITTAVGYTNIYPAQMRMQTFRSLASGEAFTLAMNHFKASSGAVEEDTEKREGTSIALLKGLDAASDPDILIMGDLNTEMGERCLQNLTNAGYEEQILKYHPNDFTHWYDYGKLIDHAFANSTMAKQITDAHVEYIANKHSVGSMNAYSDHDPYVITLDLEAQPVPTYSYRKITTFRAGIPYLITAPLNGMSIAKPVAASLKYEYQAASAVSESDGLITMPDMKSAYIFEEDGYGYYYIKDYYGRYNYQDGTYYSTNVGLKSDVDNSHCQFSVTAQNDGTFKITNIKSNYYYLARTYNNEPQFSWRNWTNLNSGQYLPYLYEYTSDFLPTDISTIQDFYHPVTTTKIMVNGQIFILMPNGIRYNMQGLEVK